MLLTTIKTEDKFEHLWNKIKILGGVLQTEHQLLANKEVYSVLTYIVRPKSRIEMNKWLGQSVWDATSYLKFKNNRSYIQTYIDYYLHAWTHYKERFELLVEILCHEDTKKYFPVYAKRKNGTNGLIDYFMNGTPDVQFSRQVQEHYISQEEYERINDFPTFVDKYFRALKKLRDNSKLIEDTVSIFKGDQRTRVETKEVVRGVLSFMSDDGKTEYTRFMAILGRHDQSRSSCSQKRRVNPWSGSCHLKTTQ